LICFEHLLLGLRGPSFPLHPQNVHNPGPKLVLASLFFFFCGETWIGLSTDTWYKKCSSTRLLYCLDLRPAPDLKSGLEWQGNLWIPYQWATGLMISETKKKQWVKCVCVWGWKKTMGEMAQCLVSFFFGFLVPKWLILGWLKSLVEQEADSIDKSFVMQ